jgi:hypothetical protein
MSAFFQDTAGFAGGFTQDGPFVGAVGQEDSRIVEAKAIGDEVGDLAPCDVSGGLVQSLRVATFAPLLPERVEREVVVHPFV